MLFSGNEANSGTTWLASFLILFSVSVTRQKVGQDYASLYYIEVIRAAGVAEKKVGSVCLA